MAVPFRSNLQSLVLLSFYRSLDLMLNDRFTVKGVNLAIACEKLMMKSAIFNLVAIDLQELPPSFDRQKYDSSGETAERLSIGT